MTRQRTERPDALFADAEHLLAAALRELEDGGIRQAAEKAWGAKKRATDALILSRAGEEPRTTGQITRSIRLLARTDPGPIPIPNDLPNVPGYCTGLVSRRAVRA